MFRLWLENRLALQKFLLRPIIPRGKAIWQYFSGFAAVFFVLCQIFSGIYLVATSSLGIREPSIILNLHWVGANGLVIVILGHFFLNLYMGKYRTPGELTWWTGMVLGGIILFAYLSGTILLWKSEPQLISFLHLIERVPIIGLLIKIAIPKTPEAAKIAVHIWHTSILPIMMLMTTFLHIWLLSRQNIYLDPDCDFS